MLTCPVACGDEISQQLMQKMKKTYSKALYTAWCEDFKGYCGKCVAYQLLTIGVYDHLVMSNAHYSYDLYSTEPVSEGYESTAIPGPYKRGDSSLTDILEKLNESNPDGHNTYAVFCFATGSYGAGQQYGHVILIHAVYNGYVFWCDSKDGKARMETIQDFEKMYRSNEFVYHFDGAVCFEQINAQNTENIPDSISTEQQIAAN